MSKLRGLDSGHTEWFQWIAIFYKISHFLVLNVPTRIKKKTYVCVHLLSDFFWQKKHVFTPSAGEIIEKKFLCDIVISPTDGLIKYKIKQMFFSRSLSRLAPKKYTF